MTGPSDERRVDKRVIFNGNNNYRASTQLKDLQKNGLKIILSINKMGRKTAEKSYNIYVKNQHHNLEVALKYK